MEHRPLIIKQGQVQQLPSGDTVAGVPGYSAWKEPVAVAAELVFVNDGDVVMSDAS